MRAIVRLRITESKEGKSVTDMGVLHAPATLPARLHRNVMPRP